MDCKLTSTKSSAKAQSGMTLIELMISMAVGLVVLAVVGSVMLWSSRSFAAMANYADLDNASRNALDILTRDIRQVNGLTAFTTNAVTFTDSDGAPLQFTFNSVAKTLVRTKSGITTTLLRDCDSLTFAIFQRNLIGGTYDQFPVANNNLTTCKLVQVNWVCSRKLLPTVLINTESIQTAKIVIRNQ